jgi:hypothetical protein
VIIVNADRDKSILGLAFGKRVEHRGMEGRTPTIFILSKGGSIGPPASFFRFRPLSPNAKLVKKQLFGGRTLD